MKYIELKDDDILAAIIEGTNANAHLVANLALLDGVDASIKQYDISRDKVLAAIHFYLNNRDEIEQRYAEIDARRAESPTQEEQLERLKAKAEAWRKQQVAQKEEQ